MHCTVGISCCPWELRHRQPRLKRRVRPDLHITNENMFKWNAFRFIYIRNLYARNSDLHPARSTDADTHLSRRTNGDLDPRTHLQLSRRSNDSGVERMDGHSEDVYDAHRHHIQNVRLLAIAGLR